MSGLNELGALRRDIRRDRAWPSQVKGMSGLNELGALRVDDVSKGKKRFSINLDAAAAAKVHCASNYIAF